jgi:hypothetical protein
MIDDNVSALLVTQAVGGVDTLWTWKIATNMFNKADINSDKGGSPDWRY